MITQQRTLHSASCERNKLKGNIPGRAAAVTAEIISVAGAETDTTITSTSDYCMDFRFLNSRASKNNVDMFCLESSHELG